MREQWNRAAPAPLPPTRQGRPYAAGDPQMTYLRQMAETRPRPQLARPSTWLTRWRYLVFWRVREQLAAAATAAAQAAADLDRTGRPEAAQWRLRAHRAQVQATRAGALLDALTALDPSAYGALLAMRRQGAGLRMPVDHDTTGDRPQ